MSDALLLKCGKPESNNSASFSRFVFPFSYCLEELPAQNQAIFYQQINPTNNQQRKKYLTNETALVLFERAKWFVIEANWEKTAWHNKTISVSLKTGEFQIKMLPPSVVLFEFPKKPEKRVLQTGFLYVDIYFPEGQKPIVDDLLLFNELFRYFDMPYEYHYDDYKKRLGKIPIDYPIDAVYKKLESIDKRDSYFQRWFNLLNIPINHDGQYYQLIPKKWQENAQKWIHNADIQTSSEIGNFLVHVDNRCYVYTAAFIDGGGKGLKNTFNSPSTDKLKAQDFGHWVKLLNVDLPANTAEETHSISDFEKDWAKTKTYKRWEASGTWYGFSSHSGVMLDNSNNSATHLCRVFREEYFDQTLLLLYLRTTLFHFSRNLSLIVHETEHINVEKIRGLREEFSRFAILYQFPSLSNQQQAIEMYGLARKSLDIDDLYQEVQEEINNAHNFLEQEEANRKTQASHNLAATANRLTQWGIPIAVVSVIATLISNRGDKIKAFFLDFVCPLSTKLFFEVVVIAVVFVLVYLFVKNRAK